MTKIISAFPGFGKTTLSYNPGSLKVMDLEFRETKSTTGMTELEKATIYEAYVTIIKTIYNAGYYDYIFVTDNELMLLELIKQELPFELVIPRTEDKEFIETHKQRIIARNNLAWYKRIIEPRLEILEHMKEITLSSEINSVGYLDGEIPYITTYVTGELH